MVSQCIVPVSRTDTCTGFPSPQQPSSLLHLGKNGFGQNDAAVASSSNKVKGRENLNDEITVYIYMLGLRLVVGKVVLSLRPGGGDALTRGLNEVRQKIYGGALRNT